MAHTDNLLDLMDSFPSAFQDLQSDDRTDSNPSTSSPANSNAEFNVLSDEALDPQLRQLIAEFPSAFVDPTSDRTAAVDASVSEEAIADQPTQAPALDPLTSLNPQPGAATLPALQLAQPGQYAQALKRQISTFTWGQVEVYLTYGDDGLQSLWVTVGKSGTEVQSLCEAIARLINLLLATQLPIPEITRQIRGIRGADAEGLGPNRILGLADLIGKVLQEAPTVLTPMAADAPASHAPKTEEETETATVRIHPTPKTNGNGHHSNGKQSVEILPAIPWANLADDSGHAASLCPECGAELHQVNGCSGGACVVCGYSSCS
ncbi:MAG: ribonucleotide reductase [Acaryochloris sp. RU_4_1]|nr:ribonucleotide reductase [Acaryochloris sp. RU_4_1]NJR56896.1 ribonucleotide reductase [Acaryochloris sp. CRU_2_0]